MGIGVTGATTSASGPISGSASDRNVDSLTHTNSRILAGNDVTLKSGDDTTLKGAQVQAGGSIDADVGGDLTVASVQDTSRIDGDSKGGSLGLSTGLDGKVDALNGSVSYGKEKGRKAWVEEQSALIAKGNVDVTVGGHTQLDGAVIASTEGDVTLDTETFDYTDIHDHDNYKNVNGSVSGSIGIGDDGKDSKSDLLDQIAALPTIEGSYEASEKEQITRATVAAPDGNIDVTVRSDPDQDLSDLNTDLSKRQEITKDKKTKLKVYVDGAALREVASGFEGTRGALTELAKAVDNALNPVRVAIIEDQQGLQANLENQAALLKKEGLSNREINSILNTPEFQSILVDFMAAEDFANQTPTNSEQNPDSSGGVNVLIGPTQQQLVGGSILNGLVKAKSYIDTLPTEEVGAAMLALQVAMGPVKGAATIAANLALDAVAGDKIEELKQEISLSAISALIGYDRNLLEGDLIAGRYNTQTKVEATEFLVFTVLAGTLNLKGGGKGGNSALSKIDNLIDLTGHRRTHILNGHFHGIGKPGKTEFPSNWSADRIIHQVSDVATDPNATRGIGKWDSPYAISIRDGVEIRVDFYPNFKPNGQPHPNAGKISTAYPINVSANP